MIWQYLPAVANVTAESMEWHRGASAFAAFRLTDCCKERYFIPQWIHFVRATSCIHYQQKGICLFAMLWVGASIAGCVDGPMYELKKLNPVIRSQWDADRKRGPVYWDRVKEFDSLRAGIKNYSDEDKARYVQVLSQVNKTETSPELRRLSALALAEVLDREDALQAMLGLTQDKNEKVRLAVAKSLKRNTSEASTKALMAMSVADKNEHVRLLAIESLGSHKTDEVRQFLAKQLNEKSPAVQLHASLALKELTGKDFQGDVEKWKMFLNGEQVEEPAPNLANQLQSLLR